MWLIIWIISSSHPKCTEVMTSVSGQYCTCVVVLVLCSTSLLDTVLFCPSLCSEDLVMMFCVPPQVQDQLLSRKKSVSLTSQLSLPWCIQVNSVQFSVVVFFIFELSAVQSILSVKIIFYLFGLFCHLYFFHSERFLLFDVGKWKSFMKMKKLTHCKNAVFK